LASLTIILILFHRPILTGAAHVWVVNDSPLQPADAIIVPGGGVETRPFGAAKLYQQGLSEQIATFRTEVFPREELGLELPHHVLNVEVMTELAVPRAHIVVIGDHVTSTQDEVIATGKWAQENQITSVIVLTEHLSSRRVAWAYKNQLKQAGIDVQIAPLEHVSFKLSDWWLDEDGLITFQNEFIKYLYYRLRY
tara:strand:+ start:1589 stop:2173 length:585 start_codon:yes stop_codon:yes gene_type:complete